MNVTIRPLRVADAATSVVWRNDPGIWTYTLAAGRSGSTLEKEAAWIERVMADSTGRRFAIEADGRYVGNIYLTDIIDGTAQYHVFIGDRGYWGKGIARQATAKILDHAWSVLELASVELAVHRANEAALALYRRQGFQDIGAEGDFVRMRISNPGRTVEQARYRSVP